MSAERLPTYLSGVKLPSDLYNNLDLLSLLARASRESTRESLFISWPMFRRSTSRCPTGSIFTFQSASLKNKAILSTDSKGIPMTTLSLIRVYPANSGMGIGPDTRRGEISRSPSFILGISFTAIPLSSRKALSHLNPSSSVTTVTFGSIPLPGERNKASMCPVRR